MGQQSNKTQKRRRRINYNKRVKLKERLLVPAKPVAAKAAPKAVAAKA